MHQVSNADPYWPGCNSSPADEQMQFKLEKPFIKQQKKALENHRLKTCIGCRVQFSSMAQK